MAPVRSVHCTILLIMACSVPVWAELPSGTFWDDQPHEYVINRLLSEMTPEEIVSQVFLVGWPTARPTPQLMEWIARRNIGGVKVFGWNADDLGLLAESITQLQRAATGTTHAIPLFTATDQEGGWVRHVRGNSSMTPGNMAIGATGLPQDALRTGYYIGAELRALGINMNFAPTVDVFANLADYVIGPRAFSSDPIETAMLGSAFFHGMESHRVIATAKHFPGHGNAAEDSHGVMPIILDTMEQLSERDLVPYRILIREGIPAILSGHLSFPEVSGELTPASLSAFFKTELLRGELGFEGIVLTDDLYMGGVFDYGRRVGLSFPELVLLALEAGSDMVMLSRTPELNDAVWRTVYTAYRQRPEFRDRLDESVRRILRVKLAYIRPEDRVPLFPDPVTARESVPHPLAHRFFTDHAFRSVTVTASQRIPLQPRPGERILLAGKYPAFLREGGRWFPAARQHLFSTATVFRATAAERAEFRRIAAGYDTVVFCLSDPATVMMAQELRTLGVEVILFSVLSPSYLHELGWVRTALAVYGWGTDSYRAGFSVLTGAAPAGGVLPIRLYADPR